MMRKEGEKQADKVRQEMAARIEKQVRLIEDLLQDKKELSQKVEEMMDSF